MITYMNVNITFIDGLLKVLEVEVRWLPRRKTLTLTIIYYFTRLADYVLMARGVIMVQTVGLSKPVSLKAP